MPGPRDSLGCIWAVDFRYGDQDEAMSAVRQRQMVKRRKNTAVMTGIALLSSLPLASLPLAA